MKQLELNEMCAKLQTEHGVIIKISEDQDGCFRIVLHALDGQIFGILPVFDNVV